MFDNLNPYTLRTEVIEGITHFFISFLDGQATHRETEVSRPVYMEFLNFVKVERSLRHWDERHREYSEMTDETQHNRALTPPQSLEETVFDSLRNEHLRLAIRQLPEIQRRRFILYHEFGFTYEQIGKMEGCTKRAIKFSIDLAHKRIREKLNKI